MTQSEAGYILPPEYNPNTQESNYIYKSCHPGHSEIWSQNNKRAEEIYMYTHTHIYPHICMHTHILYIHKYICVYYIHTHIISTTQTSHMRGPEVKPTPQA